MVQSTISQSSQKQDLELFLKERLEESNIIFDNLTSKSSQKDDTQELEEEYVISEYINPIEENLEVLVENSDFSNLDTEESEEKKIFKKEVSDPEYDSRLPKKGDKVKVKYSDGWYTGRVHSISSKKTFFWVQFKDFEDLYKVRRFEKFKVI